MEGSEEASGGERSSTSRAPDTACVASAGRLSLAGAGGGGGGGDTSREDEEAEEEERQLGRLLSCTNDGGASAAADAAEAEEEEAGEISLREWLDQPGRSVDLLECLHVFRQIVEAVSLAHSQGVVVGNVRPSCFVMSSFNRVAFIESASCSSSGSDSCEDGTGEADPKLHDEGHRRTPRGSSERVLGAGCLPPGSMFAEDVGERGEEGGSSREAEVSGEAKKAFPLKQILLMELNWYTSPEEAAGDRATFASDIYRLGVLLFEVTAQL